MRRAALSIVILVGLSGPVWAGWDEGYAAYHRGDYATALSEFRPLAEAGSSTAQTLLGVMYWNGQGVPQDYTEAVKWYRKATKHGFAVAENNLGFAYERGQGVAQDYAEAVKWYRWAAEQGYTLAQINLGNMYRDGRGVAQDYAEAAKWYRLAAEQGSAVGQNNLGVMYVEGRGVPQNFDEAARWYRLSAEQGYELAQNNLHALDKSRKRKAINTDTWMVVILVLSAVVPALLILWYFWARDDYQQPTRIVWATFAFGVAATAPVLLIAQVLNPVYEEISNPWAYGLAVGFLSAAIPEDLAKFSILYFFCLRRVKFDSPTDGLVYGVVASMGFAALENLFYVYDGGFEVAAMRAITAVPSHALHGAIMGYFITLSHYLPERRALYLFQAITVPIFLHGLYDFPLFAAGRLPEGLAAAVLLNLGNLPVLSIELGVVIVLFRRVRSVHAKAAIHAGECTASELLRTVHRKASLASSAIAWFLLMFGGVLAWFGSLATVFALTATFSDETTPGTVEVQVVSAGVVILALLTVLGVFIFRKGVSRLNRLAVAH